MSNPDWNVIEASYRAGTMSTRELAAVHGPNESTIRARAKRGGWVRVVAQGVAHLTKSEGEAAPLAGITQDVTHASERNPEPQAEVAQETAHHAVCNIEAEAAPLTDVANETTIGAVRHSEGQAAHIVALESRVEALEGMLEEAGELFRGIVQANRKATRYGLSMTGPLYAWFLPTRKPSRWG